MEIKDRIRMIMEREKVSPRVFAETIGVQQSTLSHILNDRNKPSLEVVMKVHQKYDYVNLEWLLYGKGEMVVSEEETSFSSSNSDYLPSLFDENLINSSKEPAIPENRNRHVLGGEHGFVGQQDFCTSGAFQYFRRGGAVVDGALAQGLQFVPAKVTGVGGIAV